MAEKRQKRNHDGEHPIEFFSYKPSSLVSSMKLLEEYTSKQVLELAPDGKLSEIQSTTTSSGSVEIGSFKVAAIQLNSCKSTKTQEGCLEILKDFLDRAVDAVEDAVRTKGANLVLLQELFIGPYFCQSQEGSLYQLAMDLTKDFNDTTSLPQTELAVNPFVAYMQIVAKRNSVVLPFSLFERANNAYYNTVIMIDSDGSIVGRYRKSHIPDGTGYQEKFYFSPGDSGFQVFATSVGKVGIAICWDQWFPEAARSMALMGADVLLYPTAIGSEPQDPSINSAEHWQRVMQGHAAANMVPVVASNRHGTEMLLYEDGKEKQRITFYGRSFITDETGHKVAEAHTLEAATDDAVILVSTIDANKNRADRSAWGLFRDRRPELYGVLMTKDGTARVYGT